MRQKIIQYNNFSSVEEQPIHKRVQKASPSPHRKQQTINHTPMIYFTGHVRAVDFSTRQIPVILANPTGNAARLKDINFLIESAKSYNDFSIDDYIPTSSGNSQTSIRERTSYLRFLVSLTQNMSEFTSRINSFVISISNIIFLFS